MSQRKPRKQKAPFGIALLEACQNKIERENLKKYTFQMLARDAGIVPSHITRSANGDTRISREFVEKICIALNGPESEQIALYHSVGYLAPFEGQKNAVHAA